MDSPENVQSAIAAAELILPGKCAPEGETDERWQALIEVGYFIESDPEPIWSFVLKWGSHDDEDLRGGVATVLLEHLLEYHFDLLFPRIEAAARSSSLFAETFKACWKLGQRKSLNAPNVSTS
jgi:hypothetical protein